VTVGPLIATAVAAGVLSLLLAPRWPRAAAWIGVAAAAACLVLAWSLGRDEVTTIGQVGFFSSGEVQVVALGWSAAALLLGLVGIGTDASPFIVGSSLVALGAATLALATDDAGLAFTALAAGGIAAVVVPALGGWLVDREAAPPTTIALRATAASVGPAILGLLLVAWARSAVGPFGPTDLAGTLDVGVAVGLLLVTTAGLVVVRSGAIPAHLWAARLISSVSPLAVPAVLPWGAAAFTLVALGWARFATLASGYALDDTGRILVVLVALASIGLGGLAAILHDDIEHVLGYSIVQDAGVALLAFATLQPAAVDAARDWLVASAALKSALAGWTALVRWAFGVHRVGELRGWARRSPGLAVTTVIILVGSIGIPGMAIFDARVTLAVSALPGLPGYLVVVAALSPLVALGRLLAVGLGHPSVEVAGAPRGRLGVVVLPGGGWSGGGWSPEGIAWALRRAGVAVRESAALGPIAATMLIAIVGLAVAISGSGGPAT
jgi:NADH-quinone oxidoreductase subunit N